VERRHGLEEASEWQSTKPRLGRIDRDAKAQDAEDHRKNGARNPPFVLTFANLGSPPHQDNKNPHR